MPVGTLLAVQAGVGALQSLAGFQAAKNATRPEYIIPDAIEKNMSQAERMSYYGLPDAQKKEFLQNIERAGSTELAGMSDRKAGIGGVSAIAQKQRDSYMGLLSADAQARVSNIQSLMDVRANYANYEDKAFQLNQLEPFQQEMQAAQQFQAAGMQNIMGAAKGAYQLQSEGIDLFGQKTNEVAPTPEVLETAQAIQPKSIANESLETPSILTNAQPFYMSGGGTRFDFMRFGNGFNPNNMSFSNKNPQMGTFNYGE
tara:strand:- start:10781 stop:11551 length:771 start_codon:yes stop_codon:yes gene_type:complete